jgi:hypothetical protein
MSTYEILVQIPIEVGDDTRLPVEWTGQKRAERGSVKIAIQIALRLSGRKLKLYNMIDFDETLCNLYTKEDIHVQSVMLQHARYAITEKGERIEISKIAKYQEKMYFARVAVQEM